MILAGPELGLFVVGTNDIGAVKSECRVAWFIADANETYEFADMTCFG